MVDLWFSSGAQGLSIVGDLHLHLHLHQRCNQRCNKKAGPSRRAPLPGGEAPSVVDLSCLSHVCLSVYSP